jgi:integral membrane protein (TIGR01906 family)
MKPTSISELNKIILEVILFFTRSAVALVWSLVLVGLLPLSYIVYYAYQSVVAGVFPHSSVLRETVRVLIYLWGAGDLSSYLYTSLERMHMFDVQQLFGLAAFICGMSIPFILAGLRALRTTRRYYLVLLISLGVVCLYAFDWAFVLFHEVLFSNDLWLLDPGSYLLILFPSTFFVFMAIFVFGVAGIFCVLSRE